MWGAHGRAPQKALGSSRHAAAQAMRRRAETRLRRNILVGAAAVTLVGVIAAFYLHWSKSAPIPEMASANAMPVTPVPGPQAVTPGSILPMVQGGTEKEIVFGQAVPLSGAAKELGRQMKTGVEIAFAGANEAGGVNGRKLRLVSLDDGYEPSRNQVVMKELAETQKVFWSIGNVGTPTAAGGTPLLPPE